MTKTTRLSRKAAAFYSRIAPLFFCLALPAFGQSSGDALDDELIYFHAPSGNISCLISLGEYAEARCDMKHLTPSTALPPLNCDMALGKAFSIGSVDGIGQTFCVDTTVLGHAGVTLGVGKTVTLWELSCTSTPSGMSCTNAAGHGFAISRANQTLF